MAKKRLKIAFLSFYSGSSERGVESLVFELAKRLGVKHDVFVYQEGKNKVKENFEQVRIPVGMDWSRDDMSETVWRRLFVDYRSRKIGVHTIKTIKFLLENKHDVIVPLNGGWQSLIIRIFCLLTGAKMVISAQSGIGWDDRFNSWTLPNRMVALTDFQVEWIKKVNPFVQVTKIPNGANTLVFDKSKQSLNLKLKEPTILTVAALVTWKRLDLVIKAVSKLKNGSLLIVGKGSQQKHLSELGRKLLPGRFMITSLPYKDISKAYRSADLFTFPTDPSESFGIVMIEAMATGLAVVASDDPIRREIVGNAGIFVDPTNTKAYSKALKKALDTNWGNKPRMQAEKFSWDKIAKQYEKLFLDLTDS